MDYDATAMPAVYDAGRGYSPRVLDGWLAAIARVAGAGRPIRDILDLGCGTGRYTGALAARFGASVVGIDPSEEMLAHARRKSAAGARYQQGAGEALPLPTASVDMVFMSMVFHHFAERDRVARECLRVLRSGGVVVLRAGVTDRVADYPYVPFMPRTRELIERSLTSLATVGATFEDAGFVLQAHELVMSETAASWPDYAERVALRADSILVQLAEDEFAEGLAALRTYAATAKGAVTEPTDLFAFRKPTGSAQPDERRPAGDALCAGAVRHERGASACRHPAVGAAVSAGERRRPVR
jgi:SAM-dependent methyltransferase